MAWCNVGHEELDAQLFSRAFIHFPFVSGVDVGSISMMIMRVVMKTIIFAVII